MTDDQIKHMVERFLCWKLPADFRPDAGISFKAEFNENTAHPMRHEPSGTNLFHWSQAEAMVRHMVEGLAGEVLARAFHNVRQFHETFGHPVSDSPCMQPVDRAEARADWIADEVQELRDAATITEQADAYVDMIYFALGGLVEMGIEPSAIWDLVHGANMAKVQPDGSVLRRADGKIVKPEGWTPPDLEIAREIARRMA